MAENNPEGDKEKAFHHIFQTNLAHHERWDESTAMDTCLIYTCFISTEDKEKFQKLISTEDKEKFQKLISTEDEKKVRIIWKHKDDDKRHAEEQLIGLLKNMKDLIPKGMEVVVHVYINNSPCRDCAEQLIDFLEKYKNAHLTIYAASLYNIKRESCKNEHHLLSVRGNSSQDNEEGLRKLNALGNCDMKVFDKTAWVVLRSLLQIHQGNFDKDYISKNDRTREEEDKYLKEDLEKCLQIQAP